MSAKLSISFHTTKFLAQNVQTHHTHRPREWEAVGVDGIVVKPGMGHPYNPFLSQGTCSCFSMLQGVDT